MKQKGIGQKLDKDYWERLNKHAEVIVWEDVGAVVGRLSCKNYRLALVVTREPSIPDLWRMRKYDDQPLVVFSGMNDHDESVLVSFIENYLMTIRPVYDNDLFDQSLRYIEAHLYDQELNLDKVASQIFVSRCHYSRLFQKHVGIGFKEYIIQKRMERAKMLLMSGRPVTDVCFSVGYNDLTHFGRVFKKIVGTNPSAYRHQKIALNGGMK